MEKLKVLIVDDEPIVSDFIKIRLATEAPHFSISQVESGYDCLDYLKENQADCILSDYQMPGMDGMELLRRLRSGGNSIPFIFITGQGNEEVASEAFKNGASDYFTKDIGFAHFPRIVNSIERAVRDRGEQENREKYKLLFESNPNPMLVYDINTLEMLAVNNAAVSHYGYSKKEFLKMSVKDIRPPEDSVKFLKTIEQIKKGGEKFRESGAWRHRKKNGNIIDVQISSHSINFEGRDARVVLVDDITEQKKAEAALVESERRLREMLENVKLIAVMLDSRGRVIFCNDFLLDLTGWKKEELLGREWFETFIPPEQREKIRSFFFNSLNRGEILPHYENQITTRSGERKEIFWNNSMMRDSKGNITGTTSIGEDVTKRKRAEEERSAMFHMLTHDIRSPLSVIYGYGSLASQMKCDDAAGAIADMQKAAKRIYSIIDNILSLSRLDSQEGGLMLQPVSVAELVNQAVRENEAAAAEKKIEIRVNADQGPPSIYCDNTQLGRAVSNLLSNAINYNREGGRVEVRSGDAGKKEVFIEVSDNGRGIDEDDLPRVFDKYYRGKESRAKKGAGLGLAIVKAVVEGHGGRVEVRTRRGEGSTFRLVLPVKPGL